MADVSMLRTTQGHLTEALEALHEWYQAAVDEADKPLVETEPAPAAGCDCPPTLRTGRRPSWCVDLRPDSQCDGCPSWPCKPQVRP